MRTPDTHSRPILVSLGDTHVLIDPAAERIHTLNAPAAELWQRLETGGTAHSPAEILFLRQRHELGILAEPTPMPLENCPDGGTPPKILSSAPLQVAANTSDPNPFSADSSW